MAPHATATAVSNHTLRLNHRAAAVLPRRASRAAALVCRADGAGGIGDRFRRWAREQRLEQKAKQAFEGATEAAQSTAQRLDAEYDLRKKAADATARVEREVQNLESKTGIGRKLRIWVSDFQRTWPGRKRQLQDFASTPLGQFVIILLFVLLLQTGLFWRLLSWVFLLSWLAPLLLLPLLQRQAAEQAEAMRRAAEEEQRRRANPFGAGMEDILNSMRSRQGGRGSRRGGSGGFADDGPIIDVSWEEVDDGKK